MDADGSHAPEDLPALLAALDDADLVIGSRYVPGGRVVNWPAHREWLSRGGNLYSRLALGVPIRDITGGYRAFRRQVLEELALGDVASQGYCFQVDMAWRAVQAGFRVREVPITFTERERGSSKMSQTIVAEALWRVTRWGAARLLHRVGRPAGRCAPEPCSGADTTKPGRPGDPASSCLRQAMSARRSARSSSRSVSSTSRSATDRRSSNMSQCVRGGFAFFCSGSDPSTSREMLPCRRHSQVAGASASSAKGTSKSCPRGHA